MIIGGGIVALIAIGIIVASNTDKPAAAMPAAVQAQAPAQPVAQAAPQAELQTFSAADLVRAYGENTVAADELFKGKRFKVQGAVGDINTDFMGDPYLTLDGGGNPYMKPQFAFSASDKAALANVRKGQRVTLACTGNGDMAKMPMSKDCTLL
jgi:flagellar basal body-associated protein FliL